MMLFVKELKRRKVIKVAIAYAIVAWALIEVTATIFPILQLPDWSLRLVLLLSLLGFPVTLVLAWVFDVTPEGVRKTGAAGNNEPASAPTGQRLNYVMTGALVAALGFIAYQNLGSSIDAPPTESTEARKTIAVLPFAALSSGEDDGYFADGLTEEILNSLAQLPELRVTARTSSFYFKGQDLPANEIAARLNVTHVIEGSVRRSGEQLRVSAKLISATDGIQLWSQNYDRTMDDVLVVQEDIAESVAQALEIVMDDAKRRRMRESGLRDTDAFIAFVKGMELNAKAYDEADLTGTSAQQAHAYFQEALDRVPDFAPALYLHSDLFGRILFGHRGLGQISTPEELSAAEVAFAADMEAASAAATDPAWRALIDAKRIIFSNNWRGLTERLQRAYASETCMPPNWVFEVSPALGYSENVLPIARRTVVCDPFNVRARGTLVFAQFWMGDVEGALDSLEDTERQLPDGGVLAKFMWTPALIVADRAAEAEGKLLGLPELWAAYSQAMLAAVDGRPDEVRMIMDALGDTNKDWQIIREAWTGSRDAANSIAAEIDAEAAGSAHLANVLLVCICGAPFDLEATPNFANRLEEANIAWPPARPIVFPAKDW